MQKLDDTLDEMTGNLPADAIPEISGLMQEGLSAIDAIALGGNIDCPCGRCDLTLRLCRTGVTISCTSCGASEFIKLEDREDIRKIKTKKSIKLI